MSHAPVAIEKTVMTQTPTTPDQIPHSFLLVSVTDEEALREGLQSGAHVLLIDASAGEEEDKIIRSRNQAADFLRNRRKRQDKTRDLKIYVQINPLQDGVIDDDLATLISAAPDGIFLPNSLSGHYVTDLDVRMSVEEALNALPENKIQIMASILEMPGSIFKTNSYQRASPRLSAMTWDCAMLSRSLGSKTTHKENGDLTPPFQFARQLCLYGAIAAKTNPIDTPFYDIDDLDGLAREAQVAHEQGFVGKMALHPCQVPIINRIFTQ